MHTDNIEIFLPLRLETETNLLVNKIIPVTLAIRGIQPGKITILILRIRIPQRFGIIMPERICQLQEIVTPEWFHPREVYAVIEVLAFIVYQLVDQLIFKKSICFLIICKRIVPSIRIRAVEASGKAETEYTPVRVQPFAECEVRIS